MKEEKKTATGDNKKKITSIFFQVIKETEI